MNTRAIAYYLPQFHPISENDKWWGKGFTEWTNVTKAKPLFKGHWQPRFPADLGYYDLRLPEVREAQADLARSHGIEGFCYYHYWFGGNRQLLERPFNEVLDSGKPDFPFCLCWANESWKGIWFGASNPGTLMEQTYPGREDYENHFNYLRRAFEDKRYITIDGKPLFYVYMASAIPDLKMFTDTFRELAHQHGFKGIYLLAGRVPLDWDPRQHDFDGVVGSEFISMRYYTARFLENVTLAKKIKRKILFELGLRQEFDVEKRNKPIIVNYEEAIKYLITNKQFDFDYFPVAIPNWDNTPRAGVKGVVFNNSTPDLWRKHLLESINKVAHLQKDHRIVFIKSWNEWAESNYLEPDTFFGTEYLEVIKQCLR